MLSRSGPVYGRLARFVLWVFMCPTNFILFCVYFVSLLLSFRLPRRGLPRPIFTARAITPLLPLHGYHACIFPGYHAIVFFYSWVITPQLSRSTTQVHRVITPAISNSYFIVLSFTGFYATTSNLLSLAHTARTHSTQWTASSDGWLVRCSPVDRMFVLSRI